MSESEKQNTPAPVAAKPIIEETRIDEFAIGQFAAMGHETVLSDTTVQLYNAFKLRKDRLHPSRLTPEGFAFVDLMADILDGRIAFPKATKPEA